MAVNKEYNSLGEFLKDHRLNKGLTQQEFAEQIGTTRTRYNLFENNKVKPGIAAINGIAKACKRHPAFIRALAEKK